MYITQKTTHILLIVVTASFGTVCAMWEYCFPLGPYEPGRCIPDDLQCELGKETRKGNLREEGIRLRFSLPVKPRNCRTLIEMVKSPIIMHNYPFSPRRDEVVPI